MRLRPRGQGLDGEVAEACHGKEQAEDGAEVCEAEAVAAEGRVQ